MRAIAIVDGEHYAPVVREALAELPYEFAAAVLVGGTEKLREDADYGVPVGTDVESTWNALLAGTPGAAPITKFAPKDQSVRFA